jgi:hypothetical protein
MEIRINLVLLAVLGAVWFSLVANEPVSAISQDAAEARELAFLEDEFARDPENELLAKHLASRYLELDRPGLAIAVIQTSTREVQSDPMVAHRLSQAYERTDRTLDALATAEVALDGCARALGSLEGSTQSTDPAPACSERDFALLEMHRNALRRMADWGVASPTTDPRTETAYNLAVRTARIASVE